MLLQAIRTDSKPFSSAKTLFNLEEKLPIMHFFSFTHYHTVPYFDTLKIYSCGKHLRKREIACNKQFLLFSKCFLPNMVLIFLFKCTLKCHLQFVSIWNSLKFCGLAMGSAH